MRVYCRAAAAAPGIAGPITIGDAGHFELIDPASSSFEQIRSIITRFQE
jgi:hypothetical protein